jgi:ribonuclease HI
MSSVKRDQYVIFCDGGSRGNPGPAATGWVVYGPFNDLKEFKKIEESDLELFSGKELIRSGSYVGETTNNVAEWRSVIEALEWIAHHVKDSEKVEVFVFMDSQLVIRQISGQYKVKQPHLKPLHMVAIDLINGFAKVHLCHVYREFNKVADGEANRVLDEV